MSKYVLIMKALCYNRTYHRQRGYKLDILFTGNLSPISNRFFDKISEDYKCVAAGEDHGHFTKKNVVSYQDFDEEEGMKKIFGTFNFESAIFFSKTLDGSARIFDELEKLENIVNLSIQYDVKNIIYLISNDIKSSEEYGKDNSRCILMQACENLCKSFAKRHGVHVMLLRVPYLYSLENPSSHLYGWIQNAVKDKNITLQGIPGSETDFLCEEDLGELILRILDEPRSEGYSQMKLSGGNAMEFSEVAKLIQKTTGTAELHYDNYILRIPVHDTDTLARQEYGWFPIHVLEDDIKKIGNKLKLEQQEKNKRYQRKTGIQKIRERFRITIEVILLFLLAAALNHWTKDNILLNFIDFRMIYVVIMGMMNGQNAGIAAAILASIGYLAENSASMQWQIIFYNVQNWLPFACYFLLGAISGYTRDKHDVEVQFAKEEHDILEQKYIFLNELYLKVLENKDSFNSQIIGYQDSFGKLYAVVKKLDAVLEDEVLYEAVNVLEDMLDNHSVAIYTINGKSDFARLNVCSKSMNRKLSKSLKLSDYPKMMEYLNDNKMFVNTDCIPEYPIYATPVFKEQELLGMILLRYADDHQMSMEFSNKFTIITDLIRDSMVRAMEYAANSSQFIAGTQILLPQMFQEVLAIKEHMREKEYLDYTLLKLDKGGRSLEELSHAVEGMVRNNDILGMNEEKEINLLLSQTGNQGIGIIRERMEKAGIRFEIIRG